MNKVLDSIDPNDIDLAGTLNYLKSQDINPYRISVGFTGLINQSGVARIWKLEEPIVRNKTKKFLHYFAECLRKGINLYELQAKAAKDKVPFDPFNPLNPFGDSSEDDSSNGEPIVFDYSDTTRAIHLIHEMETSERMTNEEASLLKGVILELMSNIMVNQKNVTKKV